MTPRLTPGRSCVESRHWHRAPQAGTCCGLSAWEPHPSPGCICPGDQCFPCVLLQDGALSWAQGGREEEALTSHPRTAGDLGWPLDALHHSGGFQFLLWTRAYLKPVVNSGLRTSLWSPGGPMQSGHSSVGCTAEPMHSCQHRQCLCVVWIARLGTSSVSLTLGLDLTFTKTRKCSLGLTDQSLLLFTNLKFRY